jgi:hypothetical protein
MLALTSSGGKARASLPTAGDSFVLECFEDVQS